jgi:hypothetical protein
MSHRARSKVIHDLAVQHKLESSAAGSSTLHDHLGECIYVYVCFYYPITCKCVYMRCTIPISRIHTYTHTYAHTYTHTEPLSARRPASGHTSHNNHKTHAHETKALDASGSGQGGGVVPVHPILAEQGPLQGRERSLGQVRVRVSVYIYIYISVCTSMI